MEEEEFRITVGELREALQNLDGDMEVILQKDPEGNGYDKLYSVDPDCIFVRGEMYPLEYSAEENDLEEDEWEELKRTQPRCVVLAP